MSGLSIVSDVIALSGPGRPSYEEASQTSLRGEARLYRHLSLLVLLLPTLLLTGQQHDSLQVGGQPDTLMIRVLDSTLMGPLFHNPPVAILNDRPFRIDFFVDFDPEDIASVSLLLRGDSSQTYKEIPLSIEYTRYRHTLPVEELRGSVLTYYFLVTLKDYSLWAYPVGEDGRVQPFVIDLVPPTREFFQKRYYD